jgi:phosphomethylpyrimidine synthase
LKSSFIASRKAAARGSVDWNAQFALAFDGEAARALRQRDLRDDSDYCSMCGKDWCAMRISRDLREEMAKHPERS